MAEEWEIDKGEILENRYAVKDLIATGGIGKTYLAIDSHTQAEVVLKALNFNKLKNWKELELFKREVQVLKKINYPFIPNYYNYFETKYKGQTLFILVQEYVNGRNLFRQVKEGKRFSIDETKEILKSLLTTLDYIHSLNPPIVHRDITPKNIIIDNNQRIYLVDFGAVGHIMEDTLTAGQSDTFVGTIGYMPHEQLYGKATPPSISLPYSLGVTVLFLLTGKEPFQFKLKDMRLDYASVVKIPSAFKRLINGMIEPNLAKRIKSAKEALKILAKEKYREEREKELTQRTERQKRELKEDIQDADLGRWVDKKLKKKRLAQEKKERKKQERDQRLMKQADASPQQVFIIEEKGSSLLKVQKISILGMLLHAVKNPTFTHIMLLICLCVFIPIYVEARGFFDPTSNPLIDWITGTAVIISLYIFFIVSVGRGKTFYILITDNNKLLAYYRNPKWPFFVGNVSGLKIWKHYSGASHGGFVQDTKAWNSFTFEFGETRNVEILVNGMNKADSARIQGFVHRHGIRTD